MTIKVAEATEALLIYAPDIVKELIVKPIAESGVTQLLHISNNAEIPVFIPIVPKRAGEGEDLRVPRICTASNLVGCVVGYNGVQEDFFNSDSYRANYTIYGFRPPMVVKPSSALLPPVEITGERWIIAHKGYTEYTPFKVGELSIVGINNSTVQRNNCTGIDTQLEFILRVNIGQTVIWAVDSPPLTEGKYYIRCTNLPHWGLYSHQDAESYKTYLNNENYVIQKIDDRKYAELKSSISLLSRSEPLSSLKWV